MKSNSLNEFRDAVTAPNRRFLPVLPDHIGIKMENEHTDRQIANYKLIAAAVDWKHCHDANREVRFQGIDAWEGGSLHARANAHENTVTVSILLRRLSPEEAADILAAVAPYIVSKVSL